MASKILGKQIIIEIVALLFLVMAVIYSSYAIKKSQDNDVRSQYGMVTVLDDRKFKALKITSDGEGMLQSGVTYTVTNNNQDIKKYNLVIFPNVHDNSVLEHVKVGVDDLAIYSLTELERDNGGYVITTYQLKAGYTKVHLIKLWYDLNSTDDILSNNISFDYKISLVKD